MLVKQISVFLENKSGRLAEVTKLLGENGIDIKAFSIADTTDFGIFRLVVDSPDKAEKVLDQYGFSVTCTSVLTIAVANEPGGLALALDILGNESITTEYMYAVVGKPTKEALIILRVDDPSRSIDVLTKNNIKILDSKEVYSL